MSSEQISKRTNGYLFLYLYLTFMHCFKRKNRTHKAVAALWDPLPYSSPSTPDCSGAPFGRGTFPGGQVRSLGDFGVLVYPPSGVARQSPCTLALLSIGDVARPLH